MDENLQKNFSILYGTQTLTAEYASEEMGRECMKFGYNVEIQSMDHYRIFNLPTEKLVVFIVATTGEGEPPQSMKNSWNFLLRKDLPSNSLKNLQFTVFGLGDSSYEYFNAMAKKLAKRLIDLGGTLVHEVGLGDYQHDFGYQGEFDPWLSNFIDKLNSIINKPKIPNYSQELLPSVYSVHIEQRKNIQEQKLEFNQLSKLPQPYGAIQKNVYLSKVKANNRITNEKHFQDVRFIELDLSQQQIYSPGDIIMILPKNEQSQILQFIQRLNYQPDQILKISINNYALGQISRQSLIQFPDEGITIFELFSYWINLMEPPSRYFLQVLSNFTEDSQYKEKLIEMSSKSVEGKSEYYRYCINEKRTVIEVLSDFNQAKIKLPLNYLIQLCGKQKPREFSISSSVKQFQNGQVSAHITMAVTDYFTKYKRHKKGICSSWLQQQLQNQINDPIPIWIKQGSFQLPLNIYTPIIMVGPGTGVAAFRSFIYHYHFQEEKPQMVLIFGCRSQKLDYYFEDEWKQIDNLRVITAFSRDNEDGSKNYVQHVIKNIENSNYLSELIVKKNAFIYVSGRAKLMPASVEKAFSHIISEYFDSNKDQKELFTSQQQIKENRTLGQKFIQNLKKQKRYQQEVW